MIQAIRKIGNSRGIILSKTMLNQVGILDKVEMEIIDKSIIIRKATMPREGWEQAFETALKANQLPENDMFEGLSNGFDQNEWNDEKI